MGSILLVNDDPTVRGVVSDYLRAIRHSITETSDGINTLGLVDGCDLVILDLMLPGIDGLKVFRRIRSHEVIAPVIVLTAKGSGADRVLGLGLGAGGYLTKPFSPREPVLRVNAVLRRQQPRPEREIITNGDLAPNLTARRVTLASETLTLTLREFDLLTHLVTHPEKVFSRKELIRVVWGWDIDDASTVTTHVRRLHGEVEPDLQHPTRLVTV